MADRRIGNGGSMVRRGRHRKETGTCNVCSAPCSSCMHRNGVSFKGSKSDESSDENSHGVVASQSSFNEVKAFRGSSRNSASEASNLVNSNHDATSSENDESPKDRDSKEEKSQSSSRSLLSDRKARNILGKGRVKENSGAENNNKGKKGTLSESSTHSNQSGKSGENSPSDKAEEPNTSAMSESESESENESADSEMELDVKVCDICGDAGREDLLAICSRCSDGAEHIYCMRVMLKKVPEGDWLCEECKFAEEAEKKKLEIKARREAEANLYTQSSNKRQIDKSEAAPEAKRQAVEAPIGSPKKSSLPRLTALSRETSFKGVEKPTRKLAHHSSFNSHSSDDTESTRSTDSQLQSPKGSFFKSNSFNSTSARPKVRPADDAMLPRRKESGSIDVKEGSSRNLDVGNSRGNNSISSSEAKRKDDVDGLPRSRESREAGEKSKDTVGNRSKGQNTEPTDTSCNNPSTTTRIREDANKGNRLRAAVDAALRKKPSFGKNRELEQSELPSVPNKVDSGGDNKVPSKVSVTRDWPLGLQRTDKQTTAVNGKQPAFAPADATVTSQSVEPEAVKPFTRDWPVGLQKTEKHHPRPGADSLAASQSVEPETVKPFTRDWPVGLQRTEKQPPRAGADSLAASQSIEPQVPMPVMRDLPVVASTVLSTTSAIPEPEYIWQGDLEVQRSRNLSAMHSGIQAYLSTIASPKVAEVMKNQFPVKVTLNEVPRLSAWPSQFQDKGAKEEHVALFFFAKDIESYGKSYKPLVDNMIQKDLALKGNLEGVELLIFASNQLPQNCQRWNTLYFLWGVFRGRRKQNCSNPVKNNTPLPAPSNVLPNMGERARKGFRGENPSNRESSINRAWSRTKPYMKEENGKKDEAFGAKNDEEAEEGEIGGGVSSAHLKDEKNKTERIVFPLDLNEEKEDEEEDEGDNIMVVDNPIPLGDKEGNNDRRSLGLVPNLELALGEEKTGTVELPFMARTTSLEEHRSSSSNNQIAKNQEEDGDDDAASLSLSLSFSSLEQQKKQKQNVNTPLFLFRDFPDKSSSS